MQTFNVVFQVQLLSSCQLNHCIKKEVVGEGLGPLPPPPPPVAKALKKIQEYSKLLSAYYINALFSCPHIFINTKLLFLRNSFYLIHSTLGIKNMTKI